MDIYKSIGEPDSLYGCGGGRMLQPLARYNLLMILCSLKSLVSFLSKELKFKTLTYNRIRTYEHEAVWDKALLTYDLEAALSPSTRQAGIIEVILFFNRK